MKVGGIDPKTIPNEDLLVLPRGNEHQIVIRARGLADLDEFNAHVPMPQAPAKLTPQGIVPNLEEPGFKQAVQIYNDRRLGYLVIQSLKPSAIEWDLVKEDVPGTWTKWEEDLKSGGFTQMEVNLIYNLVMSTNSLDEAKLAKARESFLLGLKQASAA